MTKDVYDDSLRDIKGEALMMAIEALSKPTVNGWIPFKTRPLTKAEKEEHPEWDGEVV